MQVLSGTRSPRFYRSILAASGLLLLATASGCSLLEDRSERYVNAKEGTPLELPESADASRFSQVMPIREINAAESGKMYPSDIPRPPDMTSGILEENYVIEELDGRIWLLVNDVPGRLWPQATAYMNERGLGVAYDSPQLGLLQSELANFSKQARQLAGLTSQASTDEPMTIIQMRITPGIRRKTTEIQVRRVERSERPGELLPWQDVANPPAEAVALQKELLADLGEFLKAREESKSFSRAASDMTSEPLVNLQSENERAVAIRMALDYGRSWAETNRALEEAEIPVIDLNRNAGWLYVDFRTGDEKEPGWFDWFSDKEKPRHTHTVTLEERDGAVFIEAERLESYDGEHTTSDLLNRLFEYLY
ncbi:MAG: outer membrane protein assembly factor BamC [Pseudomonadota bacterium]|nr:outer membrane protein assembly factor BamC [Pseudomonadota bacterium]